MGKKKPNPAVAAAKRALKKAQIIRELSGKAQAENGVRTVSHPSEALCFTCSIATPLLCDWFRNGSRQGLKYKIKPGSKSHESHVVITGCERYAPGPLPPVSWEKLDCKVFMGVAGQ